MSKSKIRLHYWNGRGRAEPIRFALAAANLEFENAVVSEVSAVVDLARRFFSYSCDVSDAQKKDLAKTFMI